MSEHILIAITQSMLDSRAVKRPDFSCIVPKEYVTLTHAGDSHYIYLVGGALDSSYMITSEAAVKITNQLLGLTNDRNQTPNPSDISRQDNIPGSST